MPYSTALAIPLNNFETAQNYKDRQDLTASLGDSEIQIQPIYKFEKRKSSIVVLRVKGSDTLLKEVLRK